MNKFLKLALSCVMGVGALGVILFVVWALIYHTVPFIIGLGVGLILIGLIRGSWDAITSWEKK